MGNGPSLNKMDLSLLSDEITIGLNGIYKRYLDWGWHNDFIMFEDIEQTELRGPDVHKIDGPLKMASLYNAYAFKADNHTLFFNSRLASARYWCDEFPMFSVDFPRVVYLGSTVTYIALQWAYYLGCNPIYLIGVDHNYGKLTSLFPPGKIEITKENIDMVRECHFDPNYYKIGDVIGVPHVQLQENAYTYADQIFRANGKIVYNAGVDSKLDVFERCVYEEIFK